MLLGTCDCLPEESSEDGPSGERWIAYIQALSGASGCILAALACLGKQPSRALTAALDRVLKMYCELGEELLQRWPHVSASNPVMQHLRMLGAWLLATDHYPWPERIARIVAKTQPPRGHTWNVGDRWMGLYPTEFPDGAWRPPLISVNGQRAVPHYWAQHGFMTESPRETFEELIGQVAKAEREKRSRTRTRQAGTRRAGRRRRSPKLPPED